MYQSLSKGQGYPELDSSKLEPEAQDSTESGGYTSSMELVLIQPESWTTESHIKYEWGSGSSGVSSYEQGGSSSKSGS